MPDQNKIIKRLSTTLPDSLAAYVGAITGHGGEYETPSEFIRDLIRRHMEKTLDQEKRDVEMLLLQALSENDYDDWSKQDIQDLRQHLKD
ncbi:MAG TPA: hypothetical protein DEA26_06620 [Oceanospirillales bacterium]|nr:hypothetical protein [Oceanospirillaceae bacterium]HBS42335.1 hypothetical protein [Oceanospirillales bacterium]|tara:strand:+ start:1957 stop:2226 length:270 start_codon:yes stop_codon:yes gene_type:complete